MKTLILTCVSCILLAGVYITLTNKSAVSRLLSLTKTPSAALSAIPVVVQEEAVTKLNLDAETSLAPVVTLPTDNNSIPVINATATEPVTVTESPLAQEKPASDAVDSTWIDHSVFQKEAEAVAAAFAKVTEVDASLQVIEPEKEENSFVHVPFLEEVEEEAGPALESRRLIMKLNPEMADSAARFSAPARVSANSIAEHAVIVAPAAAQASAKVGQPAVASVSAPAEAKIVYAPSHAVNAQGEAGRETYSYTLLYDRAEKIKAYAARKGYDTSFAFMIDMGMKSGKKRFFVMDLNTMTIVKRGMVAHGRGTSNFTFNKNYSNSAGSNCTSLGIYKVGAQYKGSYGVSFKLMGLEGSNSNAFNRSIILHGMSCIPYGESEAPICQSEGCPSLSPAFLKEIAPIISSRHKPMLMWIYDPLAESIEEEMVSNN
jgi:hypothetical protein